MRARIFGVIFAIGFLPGCMASGTQLVRDRAGFDLNCPKEQLNIKHLSGVENGTGATFGVRGCGKRATYVRHDINGVALNSAIQPDP